MSEHRQGQQWLEAGAGNELHGQPQEVMGREAHTAQGRASQPMVEDRYHMRILLEGERHLQEIWDSTSSSNESLESRPIFLTSPVVVHTLDGHLPAMCCLSPRAPA